MIARRGVSAGLALVAALALAGCGLLPGPTPYVNRPSDGGVPAATAIAELESMPGIVAAEYTTVPWIQDEDSPIEKAGMDVQLTLTFADDHRITDPVEFLREAARTLWSINDGSSPQGKGILVLRGGLDIDHDWVASMRTLLGRDRNTGRVDGDGPATTLLTASDGSTVALGERTLNFFDSYLADLFGEWPAAETGDVASHVAAGLPEAIALPAIGDLTFVQKRGSESCWFASHLSSNSREVGHLYDGPVSATLYIDDVEHETILIDRTQPGSGQFCGPEFDLAASSLSVVFEAPGDADFDPVRSDPIPAEAREG